MEGRILSAALYCAPAQTRVSRAWADAVVRFFDEHGLPLQECEFIRANGRESGARSFAKARKKLWQELDAAAIGTLGVYAHRERQSELLTGWQGYAYLGVSGGMAYVGLLASEGLTPGELLRRSYTLSKPVAGWVYGIGYWHSSLYGPEFFASGMITHPPDFHRNRDREEETKPYRDRVACWGRELRNQRRHLQGWFWDVFPANLLSERHVEAPLGRGRTLRTSGFGTFEPIDPGVWLWEVSPEQLPRAKEALGQAGLLLPL